MDMSSTCDISSVSEFSCRQEASEIANRLREDLKDGHVNVLRDIRRQQIAIESNTQKNQEKLYENLFSMRKFNGNIKILIFKAKSQQNYTNSQIEQTQKAVNENEHSITRLVKEEKKLSKDIKHLEAEQTKALEKKTKELVERTTKLKKYESENEEKHKETTDLKTFLKHIFYDIHKLEEKICELNAEAFEAKKQLLVSEMDREKEEKSLQKNDKDLSDQMLKLGDTETQLETERGILRAVTNRVCYVSNKNNDQMVELEEHQKLQQQLEEELSSVRDSHARCSGKLNVHKIVKESLDKNVEKKKAQDRAIRLTLDKHRKKEKELLEAINSLKQSKQICNNCRNKSVYSPDFQTKTTPAC